MARREFPHADRNLNVEAAERAPKISKMLGISGGGSSGGSGGAAASNVQEPDAKRPAPDKGGGADFRDNEKGSGGAVSNAAKRPRPAQWAEMNKRQRKHWKLRHLKGGSGRDSTPSM